ncbi:hypothetical protein ACFDR9_001769 [Janthinobacterium sp. CG_23.3]|uniref:hypothetical protein n=1 Tax=Janthinobacterium sp. CG_23.3 TaxID=3349634 RepID=UPI0038D50F98
MNTLARSTVSLAVLAACALPAQAADGPVVTVSGFGTAALTMTDNERAEYARPNQVAGAKKDPRTGVDSNLGIQATAKFNDRLSLTGQGLVRKYATDHFGAELAWAFAKYKLSDDFNVRVGRIGLPVYMISDFRNVGYANTMIRPPAEVYRQVTADYFDGVDLIYQHSFDDTTVTAQFGLGQSKARQPNNARIEYKPVTALHVLLENGPFTLRFGRADATFSVRDNARLNGLLASLRKFGQGAVADQLDVNDVKGSFTSLGFGLDYKNFLVQSEYAVRKTESRAVMDTSSWYAMFGYRYGTVTPYYYYGDIKQDSARGFPGMPAAGPLAALTAGANSVAKAALQSTHAVGLRWDFHKSAALKVQIDRVKPRDGAGAFVNAAPGFTGPVNVYAAGIDFVF